MKITILNKESIGVAWAGHPFDTFSGYRCNGRWFFFWAFVLGTVFCCLPLAADDGYLLPPDDVVQLVDAPLTPGVSLSPDGQWMLLEERNSMPEIEDLARRMLRLAGLRIDPLANSRFTSNFDKAIYVGRLDETPTKVALPNGLKIANVSWSHHSDAFAVTTVSDDGSQLWLVQVDSPSEPKCLVENLHRVLIGVEWLPDGKSILCGAVSTDRGEEPLPPRAPRGPNIQESDGVESPVRTYQDLLSNPYDEALFQYYATVQMIRVQLDGTTQTIQQPALYSSVSISPDGKYLLVTRIKTPFSYLHPVSSFPHDIEVWNINGDKVYHVADVPLADDIPIEGVRRGPRSVRWRANEDATLVWAEALDDGDPRNAVPFRDQLLTLAAPFDTDANALIKVQHRFSGLTETTDPNTLIVSDLDRDRRWTRMLMHDLQTPAAAPRVLMDRSTRDRYGDPGQIVSEVNAQGYSVVLQEGPWIYRRGAGASPIGNLPFLDRQNLETLETERLWQCREGFYESVVKILSTKGEEKPTVVLGRESISEPPNYFVRDLESGTERALTEFADPTPQIRGIQRQLVKYERADGVPLSATLYLPADYQPGTRLPLFVWAYPLEFSDASTAGQVSDSPWRFTRIQGSSHLALLTQGYAIMDNATMPVIGDPQTMNDTFVEQIAGAAQAAIDKAVDLGVADPNRVGVGGHSYGAFMTANLLAHTDLFKAGVARSGAYNRTLTPFGFQAERRTFWEASDVYMKVSPFSHAHRVNQPLLLIHGEADNNSGTFPVQSQRMYQAVKGTGGTVRLVMLPHESHGYQARQSILHTHAETINWLNKYVKNASGSAR